MSTQSYNEIRDAGALSFFDSPLTSRDNGSITVEASPGYCHDAHREGIRLLATQPHSYLNRTACETLAAQDQLTRSAYRVLLAVIALTEPGNYLYSNASLVAHHIGMGYRTCLDAWHELCGYGYLTEERNEFGRLICWRVSPALAWRGRPWMADAAQQQVDAQQALHALEQEALHD